MILQVILLIVLFAVVLEFVSGHVDIGGKLRTFSRRVFGKTVSGANPTGVHEGIEYWQTKSVLHEHDGRSLPAVELAILCSNPQRVVVERRGEGAATRPPGMAACSLQDPDFDADLIAFSSPPEVVPEVLRISSSRRAIAKLFEIGCSTVRLEHNVLRAVWREYDVPEGIQAGWLETAVSYMSAVQADAGVRTEMGKPAGMLSNWGTPSPNALCIGLAFFIAAAAGATFAAVRYPPVSLTGALFFSMAVGVATCWPAYARKVPDAGPSGLPMWDRIGLLLRMLCTNAAVLAVLLFANGYADGGIPKIRSTLPVVTAHSIGGWIHRIAVTGWNKGVPDDSTQGLTIPGDVYEEVSAGRTRLVVVTRPGHFFIEWVSRIKVIDESLLRMKLEKQHKLANTPTLILTATPSSTATRVPRTPTRAAPAPPPLSVGTPPARRVRPRVRPQRRLRSMRESESGGALDWDPPVFPRKRR